MFRKKVKKETMIIFALIVLISVSFFINTGSKNKITGSFIEKNKAYKLKSNDTKVESRFCPEEMCYEYILNKINRTNDRVTCYFYEANLKRLIKAIEKKGNLYLDYRNREEGAKYIKLNKGLMHMKFCVFGNTTILGSFNPTIRGNYYDNNNIVTIYSKELADIYKEESEKNFTDKKLGIIKIDSGGTKIINCFPQLADCESLVVREIKSANKSIHFMLFSFTDKRIAHALYKKKKEGLDVKGIVEDKFYKMTPDSIKNFTEPDKNEYNMHNKVFIIDDKVVITGSYNPSYNAKYNNWENLIVISNEKLCRRFNTEFYKLLNYKRNKTKSCIFIERVIPNPNGKDKNREEVWIKNNCSHEIYLNYFFLKSRRKNIRLRGVILPKETDAIKTSGLINKKDYVALENFTDILSNISWTNASEGEIIS